MCFILNFALLRYTASYRPISIVNKVGMQSLDAILDPACLPLQTDRSSGRYQENAGCVTLLLR